MTPMPPSATASTPTMHRASGIRLLAGAKGGIRESNPAYSILAHGKAIRDGGVSLGACSSMGSGSTPSTVARSPSQIRHRRRHQGACLMVALPARPRRSMRLMQPAGGHHRLQPGRPADGGLAPDGGAGHRTRRAHDRAGQPLKASRAEVTYGADFTLVHRGGPAHHRRWLPSGRADQRFLSVKTPVGVVARSRRGTTRCRCSPGRWGRRWPPPAPRVETSRSDCVPGDLRLLRDAGVPDGVINMVTASNPAPIGDVFTGDPRVKLTFTGSTAVVACLRPGRRQPAAGLVELGGHAPFIVYPDADPVHAAKGATALKFLNSGQACISPNRLYVHRDHADAFIETMVRVAKVKAGIGTAEGVGVGPLVNEAAVAKVAARSTTLAPRAPRCGRWCAAHRRRPRCWSLLCAHRRHRRHRRHDDLREETFGPDAPIIVYDDVDQVIDLANDTNYGLAAYVYTNDLSTAIRAMEGLRFGIIGINDVNPTSAAAPFGGMNDSGLGREGQGIFEYLETKLAGIAL